MKSKKMLDIYGVSMYANKIGLLHRENGPAYTDVDGTKEWFINGKRHRKDGPAIEYADGKKEWWINDIELTEEQFNKWETDNKPVESFDMTTRTKRRFSETAWLS